MFKEFNIAKEHHVIQPPQSSTQSLNVDFLKSTASSNVTNDAVFCSNSNNIASTTPPLQHQSRSYPTGQPHLCRTPSVSSQGSLDSTVSRQVKLNEISRSNFNRRILGPQRFFSSN